MLIELKGAYNNFNGADEDVSITSFIPNTDTASINVHDNAIPSTDDVIMAGPSTSK